MKYIWLALTAIIIWLSAYIVLVEVKNPSTLLRFSVTPTISPVPSGFFQIEEPVITVINADKLFQLVNEWRVQNGYQAFIYSDFAESIAIRRLPEVKKDWSHNGFSYEKYCDSCYLGENLSRGYLTEPEILNAWLNSPSHRENLELPFSHSAIVCDNTEENYCVHIFSFF